MTPFFSEDGLEELGKGLLIPADAFNLKESMRGPAPGRFDAMAIQIQSPRGEGQMRITRDLAQRTKIGTRKAHELEEGTWERRHNAHCYRTRASVREAFWEAK